MMKKMVGGPRKPLIALSLIFLVGALVVPGLGTPALAAAKASEAVKGASALVDINNATQAELEGLKGIGPATAKKIIDGRPYTSVEGLAKAGLNAKAVVALKPFVTVGRTQTAAKASAPAATAAADVKKAGKEVQKTVQSTASAAAKKLTPGTKININTADKATLEALPEIGPVKAQAIIDGRPYKSPEDIMKVAGIKQKTFDAIREYLIVR